MNNSTIIIRSVLKPNGDTQWVEYQWRRLTLRRKYYNIDNTEYNLKIKLKLKLIFSFKLLFEFSYTKNLRYLGIGAIPTPTPKT